MIKEFKKLTDEERDILFSAPVIVSVLACCSYKKINAASKADAIQLAHLKTFTSIPLLSHYYIEVEKTFNKKFEEFVERYYPFDEEKITELKKELYKINTITAKLDTVYAHLLHKSLEGYAKHVKKASHSVVEDFVFPIPIRGLTN